MNVSANSDRGGGTGSCRGMGGGRGAGCGKAMTDFGGSRRMGSGIQARDQELEMAGVKRHYILGHVWHTPDKQSKKKV